MPSASCYLQGRIRNQVAGGEKKLAVDHLTKGIGPAKGTRIEERRRTNKPSIFGKMV